MRAYTLLLLTLACGLCSAAAPAPPAEPGAAAPGPSMFAVQTAAALPEPGAIPLNGSLDHSTEAWNQIPGSRVVRNVVNPVLIPFPAKPALATGAAVVIAPGGGFMFLSMDSEGYDVAPDFPRARALIMKSCEIDGDTDCKLPVAFPTYESETVEERERRVARNREKMAGVVAAGRKLAAEIAAKATK